MVAGDQQAPSGTPYEPAPQFWVDEVERSRPPAVTGRCWFGPVVPGRTFSAIASRQSGAWTLIPCLLRVEEIEAYGHPLGQLDQVVSARLVLTGNPPPALTREAVLVARN